MVFLDLPGIGNHMIELADLGNGFLSLVEYPNVMSEGFHKQKVITTPTAPRAINDRAQSQEPRCQLLISEACAKPERQAHS